MVGGTQLASRQGHAITWDLRSERLIHAYRNQDNEILLATSSGTSPPDTPVVLEGPEYRTAAPPSISCGSLGLGYNCILAWASAADTGNHLHKIRWVQFKYVNGSFEFATAYELPCVAFGGPTVAYMGPEVSNQAFVLSWNNPGRCYYTVRKGYAPNPAVSGPAFALRRHWDLRDGADDRCHKPELGGELGSVQNVTVKPTAFACLSMHIQRAHASADASGFRYVGIIACALLLSLCAACDPGPFEFFVTRNVAGGQDRGIELSVDGEAFDTSSSELILTVVQFDSYDEGLEASVVIETRMGDQPLDRCVLHPGICRDRCRPARETAGICLGSNGEISLNTRGCDCDDRAIDYSCSGPCSATGPQ